MNHSKSKVILLVLGIWLNLPLPGQGDFFSAKLKNKVNQAIAKAYNLQGLIYTLSEDDLDNHLFEVKDGEFLVGYFYLDQAPSMKNVFDYMIMFDIDWKIIKFKVLIYRESHGRQIGTQRWLSQFNDMGLNAKPKLGREIDGISGATISATNMTDAIRDVLAKIKTSMTEPSISSNSGR